MITELLRANFKDEHKHISFFHDLAARSIKKLLARLHSKHPLLNRHRSPTQSRKHLYFVLVFKHVWMCLHIYMLSQVPEITMCELEWQLYKWIRSTWRAVTLCHLVKLFPLRSLSHWMFTVISCVNVKTVQLHRVTREMRLYLLLNEIVIPRLSHSWVLKIKHESFLLQSSHFCSDPWGFKAVKPISTYFTHFFPTHIKKVKSFIEK